MTGVLQHPTNSLVAMAWIAAMIDFPINGINTRLPQDATQWPEFQDIYGSAQTISQFITVRVIGGTPQANIPVHHPVYEFKCFATKVGSNKPPFFAANQTAELISEATYNRQLYEFGRALTITSGNVNYNGATVKQALTHTEPRELFGDPRNYAVYSMDVSFCWTEVGYTLQ
jgi:hypothetical protein